MQYIHLSRYSRKSFLFKIHETDEKRKGYVTAWRKATHQTEGLYLAVRLRLLHVTWLCCLIAADLVIDGWGRIEAVRLRGGQELYCRGNQTSLVPHGQQDIMVLLPRAPREEGCCISTVLYLLFLFFNLKDIVLTPYWFFAEGWADGKNQKTMLLNVVLNRYRICILW